MANLRNIPVLSFEGDGGFLLGGGFVFQFEIAKVVLRVFSSKSM